MNGRAVQANCLNEVRIYPFFKGSDEHISHSSVTLSLEMKMCLACMRY